MRIEDARIGQGVSVEVIGEIVGVYPSNGEIAVSFKSPSGFHNFVSVQAGAVVPLEEPPA